MKSSQIVARSLAKMLVRRGAVKIGSFRLSNTGNAPLMVDIDSLLPMLVRSFPKDWEMVLAGYVDTLLTLEGTGICSISARSMIGQTFLPEEVVRAVSSSGFSGFSLNTQDKTLIRFSEQHFAGQEMIMVAGGVVTGKTIVEGAKRLRALGASTSRCVALMSYDFATMSTVLDQAGVVLYPLVDFEDIFTELCHSDQATLEDMPIIREWYVKHKGPIASGFERGEFLLA